MALPLAAVVFFGFADSAVAVLAYSALGELFNQRRSSARAGAARQLVYAVGLLLGFLVGPRVPPAAQLAALALLTALAWAALAGAGSWSGVGAQPGAQRA